MEFGNEKILLARFKGIVDAEFKREYQWIIGSYLELAVPYTHSAYNEDYMALAKCCEKLQCSASTLYRLDFLSTCGFDEVFTYVGQVLLDYARKFSGYIERNHPGFFDYLDK